jgi:hypothetical protein
LTEGAAYFNGVTLPKLAGGEMEIFVRVRTRDGKTSEQRFPFQPAADWERKSASEGR